LLDVAFEKLYVGPGADVVGQVAGVIVARTVLFSKRPVRIGGKEVKEICGGMSGMTDRLQ